MIRLESRCALALMALLAKLRRWGRRSTVRCRGYVSCSPAACFALLSLVRACGILPALSATKRFAGFSDAACSSSGSRPISEGRRALAFYVSGAELGRSLVMPPGVPADRVKVLRAAFRAMIEDPELPAEIAKSG